MDTDDFMAAVNTLVQGWASSAFPDMDVVYENGPVPDEASISSPWLDVSVRWYGSEQLTQGEVFTERHKGVVNLAVFHRAGEGTGEPNEVVRSLAHLVRANRRVSSSVLKAPERMIPTTHQGWYKTGLMVPFMLDVAVQ